ncbi:hypothetical protein [Isoptericola sp. NPDC019482]|uniref:hypothetical protein n=1 Tax=Isoptericola sp. NPDC019482 TaxID=3154688 RepID=UPI0034774373
MVGLLLVGVLGLLDALTLLGPTAAEGEVGPPVEVLVLDTVLGVITLAAVVAAFARRSRGAVRVAAGARLLSVLTVVPAFFAGMPAAVIGVAAVAVLANVAGVYLALAPARRTAPARAGE